MPLQKPVEAASTCVEIPVELTETTPLTPCDFEIGMILGLHALVFYALERSIRAASRIRFAAARGVSDTSAQS